jgi:hypothetical protein
LTGFYHPVHMGGVVNKVQAGRTVPLKFEVFSNRTELTDPALVTMSARQRTCGTGAETAEIGTTGSGASSLRYDSRIGKFVYNWQTPRRSGACYAVTATTRDGSSITALFRLR